MRQVQKLWLLPLFIAWIALSNCGAFSQNAKWVTGYHPTWWYGALPPSQIDFNSLTHIVLFSAQDASTSPPYFNVSGVDDGNNFEQIISLAHAKGVKVILSAVGGYGQTNMPKVAADPTMCQAFVTNSCAWAQSKGLDGIELDWEFPRAADKVGWNRLIRLFRIELDKWNPRGTLMTSMYYSIGGPNDGPYVLDSMMVFDQINPMTYTMWMGGGGGPYHAGYDTPVNLPTQYSGYVGYSLSNPASGGPLSFLQAGYPASKLGISISFEGTQFGGVSTMGPAYSSYAFCSSVTKTNSGYAPIPASGRQWDATAQAAYCISGGKVYSYQDTNSVKAITTWAKNNGFGGVMLYDIGCGYDLAAPVPDAMLKMASRVLNTGLGNGPSGTFTVSPSALPVGGGTVTLSWSSPNALTASIDQGIGSVPTSGTLTLTVTVCTEFNLTLTDTGGTTVLHAIAGVLPGSPELILPGTNTSNEPTRLTIRWSCAQGADYYNLQVSKDSLFGSFALNDSTLTDTTLQVGPLSRSTRYFTRVKACTPAGWGPFSAPIAFRTSSSTTDVDMISALPRETALLQNYPNPFNPSTIISYQIARPGQVTLKVYDALGQEVETLYEGSQQSGSYSIQWNGAGKASGVYFFRLLTQGYAATKRMILVR